MPDVAVQPEARKTLSKGRRRQQAILNVAENLFLSQGFSEVTLAMIIREAGGSRRMIYERFGGKEGLFEAVCQRIFERVYHELETIGDSKSLPQKTLNVLGRRLLHILTTHPTLDLFKLVLSENRRFPWIGQLFYESVPDKAYELLAAYLEQQIAAGTIRKVDTDVAARQFYGMLREDIHLRCVLEPDYSPTDKEIDYAVRKTVDTLMRVLAPAR